MKSLRNVEKQHLFFGIGMLIFCSVFLWRCTYSINYYDEPYGIAVIWRFFNGGAMLAEDWHPSQQLTAWILYPLYWLLHTFLGGNEGIILGFRVSYVIVQALITIYCYIRLKEYKYYGIMAVLLFMFSTHNNMTTINYNTVGIGCLMILLTTLFTEKKFSKKTLFACGVLVAIIVLAQPYSILLFLIWGVLVCLWILFARKKNVSKLLEIRTFFYTALGAAFMLLLFLILLFSRATLDEIITGIYYNLNDPEHAMDLSYKISKYFERFYRYYKYQVLLMFASAFVGFIRKKKYSNIFRAECFLLATAAFVYYMISLGWISDYVPIDFISVPMTFYGLTIFALTRKKNWKLFGVWVVPALMYTFCVQLATDTGILAVSAATIVASSGGMLMAADGTIAEKPYVSIFIYKFFIVTIVTLNILQAALFLYQRISYTWWSCSIQECTDVVKTGPAKGIRTSKEDLTEYENTLKEIDSLNLTKEDQLLVLEHATWLYLYADVPVATYSFWNVGEENYLDEYYMLHSDKKPTVVYIYDIENVHEKKYVQQFLERGYQVSEFESGNIILTKK